MELATQISRILFCLDSHDVSIFCWTKQILLFYSILF